MISLRKNFNVSLCSNFYRPISLKLGMMIETSMLYILKSVWITFTFIQAVRIREPQLY